MRRTVLLLASMALAVLLAGGMAQAIINGQPDRGAHPYVGMVYNAKSLCSGTLISPRVFLTAAHCTEFFEEGNSKVYVTFEQRADFRPDDASARPPPPPRVARGRQPPGPPPPRAARGLPPGRRLRRHPPHPPALRRVLPRRRGGGPQGGGEGGGRRRRAARG